MFSCVLSKSTVRSMRIQGGFAVDQAISLLKSAHVVILDVDSTIIRKEGIDMLASYLNKEKEIKQLKRKIIHEEISYSEFTKQSLSLLQPSRKICEACLKAYPYDIVDNVIDFIDTCHRKDKAVFLVSGGYVPMITPLLSILSIPPTNLFAIPLLFDEQGNYTGYDDTADTTKINGKAIVAEKLRHQLPMSNGVVVNIGDGILDANAYPSTDAFIGYTGVIMKKRAIKKAMLVVADFKDLIQILNNEM